MSSGQEMEHIYS